MNESYKALTLFRPQALTTTTNGTGVDTLGYGDDLVVILDVGAVSGTTPTLDVTIQDSADNSSFAAITGAAFSQFTAANKQGVLRVNLDGKRRYIRAVATIGGTTPSFTLNACAMIAAEQCKSSLNSSTPA